MYQITRPLIEADMARLQRRFQRTVGMNFMIECAVQARSLTGEQIEEQFKTSITNYAISELNHVGDERLLNGVRHLRKQYVEFMRGVLFLRYYNNEQANDYYLMKQEAYNQIDAWMEEAIEQ